VIGLVEANKSLPIGIFDSGVGGITVLKELQNKMPHEDFIYLGDTARVPYGNKSSDLIKRYTEECVGFLISKGVKMIVIACNTASSYGYDTAIKFAGDIPIIEMIKPASRAAASITRTGNIAVLGTKGTIANGAYSREIYNNTKSSICDDLKVTSIACPLFVPFIEEGQCDHEALYIIAKEYLSKIIDTGKVDTVIMGCTHYPFIEKILSKVLGDGVTLINTGTSAAAVAEKSLSEKELLKSDSVAGKSEFYVTDSPDMFGTVTEDNLGYKIDSILKVYL
jgi:glutamate racemase